MISKKTMSQYDLAYEKNGTNISYIYFYPLIN